MVNYDGQYEVSIIYDTTPSGLQLIEHTLTFDVLPTATVEIGEVFENIVLETRGGVTTDLATTIDTIVTGMIALYPAATSIIRAELNYIPEGTYDKTFVSVYAIDEVGVNGTASAPAQQFTYTFRSLGGGSGRIQLMEPSVAGNNKLSYPYGSAALNAIPDYVTGAGNPIIARDNSFFWANLHLSMGQNERLFRKRYRA